MRSVQQSNLPMSTMEHRTGRIVLACPFFVPTKKIDGGAWPHPSRLPLGSGWRGHCSAPGHEGVEPAEHEITQYCNLGYAAQCTRIPSQRSCDAVRFAVTGDRGSHIDLTYVCEAGHRPIDHGVLQYQVEACHWTSVHQDSRIQRMAECYLESYLRRRTPASTRVASNGKPD